MILSHFSEAPLAFDLKRTYVQKEISPAFKPAGLWLSHESESAGWRSWCEANDFGLGRLRGETKFRCDLSRWLVLSSVDELVAFTGRFPLRIGGEFWDRYVDWRPVAEVYAGVLVTPYQWDARLNLTWYYGWDCASACVWDLSTTALVESRESVGVPS